MHLIRRLRYHVRSDTSRSRLGPARISLASCIMDGVFGVTDGGQFHVVFVKSMNLKGLGIECCYVRVR